MLEQHDRTLISAPALDEQTEQKLLSVLESQGFADASISRPRQKLETFFLNIVAEAQAAGAETSGSQSGGKIARFLATGEDGQEPQPDELISGLMAGADTTSRSAGASDEPASAKQATHDESVIGSLTGRIS